jgi:hypothetical protein
MTYKLSLISKWDDQIYMENFYPTPSFVKMTFPQDKSE